MSQLNYKLLDEFKILDGICRDIYGKTADNKLGVTLYLEHMDEYRRIGSMVVPGWNSDYNRLKKLRHIRNELAHARYSIPNDICTEDDINFIRDFKNRILSRTDPISLLRHHAAQKRQTSGAQSASNAHRAGSRPRHISPPGCFLFVAAFLALIACIIAFLI